MDDSEKLKCVCNPGFPGFSLQLLEGYDITKAV